MAMLVITRGYHFYTFLVLLGTFHDVPIFGATHFGHVIHILTVAVKERLEPEEMVFMAMTAWQGRWSF